MQAITTKYHGPGNVRGSRVSATSESGIRISLPWNSELDSEENHRAAARALCHKLGWKGTLATGATKDAYVHVFVTSFTTFSVPCERELEAQETALRS